MALPTGNNSDRSHNQSLPDDQEIFNPFDDEDEEEESYGQKPSPAPQKQQRQGLPTGGLPAAGQQAPPRQQGQQSSRPAGGLPLGGLPTQQQRPVAPPPAPPVEEYQPVDDAFEPADEIVYEEDLEFLDPPEFDAPPQPAPPPVSEFDFEDEIEDFAPPVATKRRPAPPTEPVEEPEVSSFVNKTKKQLLPFGGKKSKLNTDHFDKRANRKAQSAVVQWGIVAAVLGAMGFGFYNAINPPESVTLEEVYAIANLQTAQDSFPYERAEAFVENFMDAYLQIDPSESSLGDPMLAYYYSGNLEPGKGFDTTVKPNENFAQDILVEPRVVRRIPATGKSAGFVVSALVEKYDKNVGRNTSGPGISSNAKWVSFAVNVYYDPDKDTMAVAPDSPILVAPETYANAGSVPAGVPPGLFGAQPDAAVKEKVADLMPDFFSKWAEASVDSHSALNTVIVENPPVQLVTGLGGDFKLSSDRSIEYTVYPSSTAGQYVAQAEVLWEDSLDSLNKATYTATYFVTLVDQGNNKFLVGNIKPKNLFYQN